MFSPGVRIIVWLCVIAYYSQHLYYPLFDKTFSLSYIGSELFSSYQFVTYGFLHGDFYHIFVNLFILAIFGNRLEAEKLGTRNFLVLFILGVIGGGMMQTLSNMVYVASICGTPFPTGSIIHPVEQLRFILDNGYEINTIYAKTTLGASGGVFGVLLAFAVLYPRHYVNLLFIQLNARFIITLYVAMEIVNGIYSPFGPIAHFAHLGGALFGIGYAYIISKTRKSDILA